MTPKNRPVTQKQIAERVGVTQQLVALALKSSPSVAAETRQRILDVAEELGYNRNSNRNARSLAAARHGTRMRSDILAVVFEQLPDGSAAGTPFFMPMLDGIEIEAASRGLDLFLVPSQKRELPWLIREGWTDGVILLGSHLGAGELASLETPLVALGAHLEGMPSLTPDDESGMFVITKHLLSIGHRRIAYIGPQLGWTSSAPRLEGYRRAWREMGLRPDDRYIDLGAPAPFYTDGREAYARLVARVEAVGGSQPHHSFTAIVCHNDPMAMGVIRAAQEMGRRVPEDLSVTGFDDVSKDLDFSPSITSLAFPGLEMGRRAVQLVCAAAQSATGIEAAHETFPVELKLRKSSAPPPASVLTDHAQPQIRILMNRTYIRPNYEVAAREIAARIASIIREKPNAVLGLATGSTPIGIYDELIRLHREEGLDFSQVVTFNLDEYYPMNADAAQSYRRFMNEQLFDHINIKPENAHVPDGRSRSVEQVEADCEAYEAAIRAAGGLDFQLLGIGRNGHIGFNEPGSPVESRTRLVVLDHVTRTDAAGDFFGLENTPVRAISMGVGTILEAREIVLFASGVKKAAIIAEALEGKITSKVPASFLREHPNAYFWLDEGAAEELTIRAAPWRMPDANFEDENLTRRTLISVALDAGKGIDALVREDLAGAGALRLALTDPALDKAKSQVLENLRDRLDDAAHLPQGQTVLCLSPHPDDDVICCGGTLLKMAKQNNRLFVAFGVSGANAVRDKDVLTLLRARHPRLISYLEEHTEPGKSVDDVFNEVRQFIFEREAGQVDIPLLRELKRLVREGEASDACRKMSAKPIFWDLPFYHENRAIEQADIDIALETLRRVQPDLVMLTGELNDPHGTHEKTVEAFERATEIYLKEGGKPFKRWKYRGAWDEWPLWMGSYYSVFNKDIMEQKIGLILDHISQLDPMFPGGSDPREFYERARDRNRQTARDLQKIGLLPPSRSFDPIYAEVFVEA